MFQFNAALQRFGSLYPKMCPQKILNIYMEKKIFQFTNQNEIKALLLDLIQMLNYKPES